MIELDIVRGRDVELRLNGTILFGMTGLSVREKIKYHEVHECMSSKPAAHVSQGSEFEIRLTGMSIFDFQIPESGAFSLSVRYEDLEYVYGGCRVLSREKKVKGLGDPECVYIISAGECTWREVEDDE